MANFRAFSSLARWLQYTLHPPDGPVDKTKVQGNTTMSYFEYAGNKALAAVFAFGVSALCMAAAIVPASPAGIIV